MVSGLTESQARAFDEIEIGHEVFRYQYQVVGVAYQTLVRGTVRGPDLDFVRHYLQQREKRLDQNGNLVPTQTANLHVISLRAEAERKDNPLSNNLPF